jgi:hypothetical protein
MLERRRFAHRHDTPGIRAQFVRARLNLAAAKLTARTA